MGSDNRNTVSRRRLLLAAPLLSVLWAACGGRGDATKPPLTDEQQSILDSAQSTFGSQIDLDTNYLADQTVRLVFAPSPLGGRNEHYRNLATGANSWQGIYPRLLDDRAFTNESEGIGLAEALGSLSSQALPDLILFPGSQLADLHRYGMLIELDKVGGAESLLDPGQYWGQTLAAGQVRGRQLAIPLMLGPWFMICNLDLLSSVGVEPPIGAPWKHEDFLVNVSRLTHPSATVNDRGAFGFLQLVSSSPYNDSLPPSWIWMLAMGANLPNIEGGEDRLQSAPALTALDLMYSLVHEQRSALVFEGGTGRSLRWTITQHANAMTSYPFNSGWLAQFWRTTQGGRVELAHLPAGPGHFTPVEMHMMLGVPVTARDREAAVASLQAIVQTAGSAVFPTARRVDLVNAGSILPRMTSSDIEFIGNSLDSAEPVMLPAPERTLLRRNIDLPLLIDRQRPEAVTETAYDALANYRYSIS